MRKTDNHISYGHRLESRQLRGKNKLRCTFVFQNEKAIYMTFSY